MTKRYLISEHKMVIHILCAISGLGISLFLGSFAAFLINSSSVPFLGFSLFVANATFLIFVAYFFVRLFHNWLRIKILFDEMALSVPVFKNWGLSYEKVRTHINEQNEVAKELGHTAEQHKQYLTDYYTKR